MGFGFSVIPSIILHRCCIIERQHYSTGNIRIYWYFHQYIVHSQIEATSGQPCAGEPRTRMAAWRCVLCWRVWRDCNMLKEKWENDVPCILHIFAMFLLVVKWLRVVAAFMKIRAVAVIKSWDDKMMMFCWPWWWKKWSQGCTKKTCAK